MSVTDCTELKLPVGADWVTKKRKKGRKKALMLSQKLGPARCRQLSCVTHTAWRGLRALTEHVLRRDRQDLASSCSYRSLLARPLLLLLLLRSPTNHS